MFSNHFSDVQETAILTEFKLLLNCKGEKSIYTINLLLITIVENLGITAISTTFSCTRLLTIFLKSSFKWRTANRQTLSRKLIFRNNKTHWCSPFLTLPRTYRPQQGKPSLSCSSTYCTSPTSTTSEMRKVVRGAVSPTADDATVSAPNQRSRIPYFALFRDTIFSGHDFKSAFTVLTSTPSAPQGSNVALFRTASAAVTAVFRMLIPVSEKKFLCVNRGWRTKSCTHAIAPLHFLKVNCNPIQRHSKNGMQLLRTHHH